MPKAVLKTSTDCASPAIRPSSGIEWRCRE